MWRAMDRGVFARDLLEAGMARVPAHAAGDFRKLTVKNNEAGVFVIEYRDGFRAAVAMLNGWVYEGDGGAFVFAGACGARIGRRRASSICSSPTRSVILRICSAPLMQ